jgi:acetyl esterase/lipase
MPDARSAFSARAGEFNIDPKRIGIYGDSEGGYVAALLGTDANSTNQDDKIQAVVDMWGFSDLRDFSGSPSWVTSIAQASRSPASAAANSPLDLVAPGDPPFLIIHGTDDWFIAPHHSQNLAERLEEAGVPNSLIMVEHDQHGIAAVTPGETESPSPEALMQTVCDFFASTLGPNEALDTDRVSAAPDEGI